MALNDAAVLAVNSGNYFTAPVGTAVPEDLTSVGGDWENVGHTSLEDILAIESEGGEATVLGTLQNSQLRQRISDRTDTIQIVLNQFDTDALKLYHGSNAEVLDNGMVAVPAKPVPTECAFLAVYVDGSNIFALWVPKASVLRADNMEIEDTEGFVGLPIGVTPLIHASNTFTYAVTPLGEVEDGGSGEGESE